MGIIGSGIIGSGGGGVNVKFLSLNPIEFTLNCCNTEYKIYVDYWIIKIDN